MKRDRFVSLRTLEERLKELEEKEREEQRFRPEFAAALVDRTIIQVRQIVREAAAEYVSTTAAQELSGWDTQTLRKYARVMLDGGHLPRPWEGFVARRQGRDYEFLVSSLPSKPARNVA